MKANRRKFITMATLLSTGAAASAIAKPAKKQLLHHVFFWLKNPESVEDRDLLIKGLKTLGKIEAVNKIHIGVLASTEKRDVVDTSWQVSELLYFNDLKAQSVYQAHPVHNAFVEKYSHLWSKVLVYDAIAI